MKKNTLLLVIFVLLIFSVFLNYKLFVLNTYHRSLIPFLLKGERIKNFSLLDQNARFIEPFRLKKGISLVYIFLKDCSPCDKNIVYWRKIAKIFNQKISVIGVVLGTPTDAFNFAEKANLNFQIYVPDDLAKYTRDMRLMINQSQTIVLQDGKVKMVKMGNMDGSIAIDLINFIKGLLK